jgi:hypothetical protein
MATGRTRRKDPAADRSRPPGYGTGMSDATDDASMDRPKVQAALQHALLCQTRSLVTMTLLAGSLRGLSGAGVKAELRGYVLAEVEDTYRLTEKLSALGAQPMMGSPEVQPSADPQEALAVLVDTETETVAALHAVIPHSGQEPTSEALEHLLEHAIMRKQQQVDFLRHALA